MRKSITDGGPIVTPWASFGQYDSDVYPQFVPEDAFDSKTAASLLDRITSLQRSADAMYRAADALSKLGYEGDSSRLKDDAEVTDEVKNLCMQLCRGAAEMLMYSKSLAESSEGYEFVYVFVIKQWESYRAKGQLVGEINQLVESATTLYFAYQEAAEGTRDFLVNQIGKSFPSDLKRDFLVARDQFSVGLEEAAFLSAGRGLEGVLRAVARKKQITIETRGVRRPAAEEDFRDVIECLSRVRWKADKSPIVDPRVKSLLHHLRTSRNATAHPSAEPLVENWRELAVVVVSTAVRLWAAAERRYAGVVTKTISKTW